MAYAARAYEAAPVREPRRSPRPDVRVIPGKGRVDERLKALPVSVITAFKVSIIIIAVLTVICGVRVWFSAAAVENLSGIQSLQDEIDSARASGNELEIQHSLLASPTRIEKEATKLGMSTASKTTYIQVSVPSETSATGNASDVAYASESSSASSN